MLTMTRADLRTATSLARKEQQRTLVTSD